VVSLIPEKYEDIWTAAKGFYKLEPVVADGGEVILYAPHVKEISFVHKEIYDIGYHCRDYFVKQWDRFSGIHWGVLAHSTHLRGAGTYDEVEGEKCRVNVTLVTSIPEEKVRRANLGYIAPEDFDLAAYEADPGTMVVPNAGETLFRLR
jgi:nickel-dependent lactate racemase